MPAQLLLPSPTTSQGGTGEHSQSENIQQKRCFFFNFWTLYLIIYNRISAHGHLRSLGSARRPHDVGLTWKLSHCFPHLPFFQAPADSSSNQGTVSNIADQVLLYFSSSPGLFHLGLWMHSLPLTTHFCVHH